MVVCFFPKMKYEKCFISWRWSQTLSIFLGGLTTLQTSELLKNQQNKMCPYNYNNITKDYLIYNILSFSGLLLA